MEIFEKIMPAGSLSYSRTMRPKSSGEGEFPAAAPDSPFYLPPPSSKALRWSITLCLVGPFLLAFSAFEFALAHQWTGLVIALVMFCVYSLLATTAAYSPATTGSTSGTGWRERTRSTSAATVDRGPLERTRCPRALAPAPHRHGSWAA